MYDEIYVGASLAVLIKIIFKKNKILIIEKDEHLGGAWRNSYKSIFKNIDLACHLIVTQSVKHSNQIVSFLKKIDIELKKIEKNNLFYDTENFKAYGKNGPALISSTGWSDMLNKVVRIVKNKRNVTFLVKSRVSKIIASKDDILVFYHSNKKILGKKIFIPTYCDLKHIHYKSKKITIPYKLIINIHYVFFLEAETSILNKNFQGFWEKDINNIFDRLSVSSSTIIKNKMSQHIVCARVSKKFKSQTNLINKKSIISFLTRNKLIKRGNISRIKKLTYNCPYKTTEDLEIQKNKFTSLGLPIVFLNTRYMGHFLWDISKTNDKFL